MYTNFKYNAPSARRLFFFERLRFFRLRVKDFEMEVHNDTSGEMNIEEPKTENLLKSSSPPDSTDDFESEASKKKARTKSPAPPRPKTPTTPAIKSNMTKSSAVIAEIKKRKLGNADMSSYRFDSSAKSPALNVVGRISNSNELMD